MDVQEKLDQGYILSKIILEMIGKPKEHVEATLQKYLTQIKENKDFDILNQEFGEAKPVGGDDQEIWATFVELELLTKDIPTLIGFCFDYMPSSIDIVEPSVLKLKQNELSTIMNDLQGKLHRIDMGAKQVNSENKFLKRNAYALATNLVSLLLRSKPRKLEELFRLSGMAEKDMEDFLKKLMDENRVKKKGEFYYWIPNERKEQD